MNRRHFVLAGGSLVALTAPAMAQFFPKTLIDRAIEARSMGDIAKDNEIVLKVNKVMADVKSVSAATEIYEQRLLITGIFDDKATYDKFEKGVRAVPDVKKLYWHVAMLTKQEQEKRKAELAGWSDVLAMTTKAQGRLIGTAGVADVNFRVTGDAFRTLYIIGRARSQEEANKAVARLKEGEGVKKVVSYIDVRP
jgi:hyperosmotically inducible protein